MRRRPIAILALGAGFAISVWMPIDRYRTERAQLAALRTQEAQLATELAEAQHEYLDVLGPVQTERLARQRLGMVRGGERAYVVPAPEPAFQRPAIEVPERAGDDPGWLGRAAATIGRVYRSLI